MKKRLTNFLKYNKYAYSTYYYFFSTLISILKLFVKPDDKLILFNSFGGRSFDDSPKAIFEEMRADTRFKGYRLVWAFHNPEQFKVEGAQKIKTDGLQYFVTALKARVWITNSSVERGLKFKGKNTFYLNTWHGTPIKKLGEDIQHDNASFKSKGNNLIDAMMSQGHYDSEILSRSFRLSQEKLFEVGLPRNDILANHNEEYRESIRRKLGIDSGQIAILYCPTFREYEKDDNYGVVMAPPIKLEKWKERLGSKYILMIRAHYEVSSVMDIKKDEFTRNMSDYPDLNDLYIATDILISDYSSVFFDYSITGKTMFHFTYDYEKYNQKRGLYFDIRKYISGGATEDEILELIETHSPEVEHKKTRAFREMYVEYYGAATKASVGLLAKELLD